MIEDWSYRHGETEAKTLRVLERIAELLEKMANPLIVTNDIDAALRLATPGGSIEIDRSGRVVVRRQEQS